MTTKFTKDHEWIRLDGDVATSASQTTPSSSSADVVFVELPAKGKVTKGGEAAVVESVKAASEVYAPVSGEVVGRQRQRWRGAPATVNEEPTGGGWFIKLKVATRASSTA